MEPEKKPFKKYIPLIIVIIVIVLLVVLGVYLWQTKINMGAKINNGDLGAQTVSTLNADFASPLTVTGASGAEAIIQVNGTTAGAGIGFSETAKGSSWRIKTASADGRLRFINVNTDIKTDVLSIMADNRIRIPGLAGSGNAFGCIDKDGYLLRTETSCK
jgi:hypothetical protein